MELDGIKCTSLIDLIGSRLVSLKRKASSKSLIEKLHNYRLASNYVVVFRRFCFLYDDLCFHAPPVDYVLRKLVHCLFFFTLFSLRVAWSATSFLATTFLDPPTQTALGLNEVPNLKLLAPALTLTSELDFWRCFFLMWFTFPSSVLTTVWVTSTFCVEGSFWNLPSYQDTCEIFQLKVF